MEKVLEKFLQCLEYKEILSVERDNDPIISFDVDDEWYFQALLINEDKYGDGALDLYVDADRLFDIKELKENTFCIYLDVDNFIEVVFR